MYESIGVSNNGNFLLNYSYHLPVAKGRLGLGIRPGVYYQALDFTKLNPVDINDPNLLGGNETQIKPDLGLGVWYRAEKWYAGVAADHLIQSEFDFGTTDTDSSTGLRNQLVPHYTFTGGYTFELTYELKLTPSVIFRTAEFNQSYFQLGAIATYNDRIWGGLTYRQGGDLTALVGMGFLEDNVLKAGIALDYGLQGARNDALSPLSTEVLISYTLPVAAPGSKPVIRTPRFRH
jgi:type IX secretion system PorP/SprF family membrane protein